MLLDQTRWLENTPDLGYKQYKGSMMSTTEQRKKQQQQMAQSQQSWKLQLEDVSHVSAHNDNFTLCY